MVPLQSGHKSEAMKHNVSQVILPIHGKPALGCLRVIDPLHQDGETHPGPQARSRLKGSSWARSLRPAAAVTGLLAVVQVWIWWLPAMGVQWPQNNSYICTALTLLTDTNNHIHQGPGSPNSVASYAPLTLPPSFGSLLDH